MKGKIISLRAPEPSDIDILYEWENDPAVWRVSNSNAPYSRYDIEQFVLTANHDIFAVRQLRLMITDNDKNQEPVGTIDLFDFDPLHRRAGIGILITGNERGKGYATDALALLCDYCFNTLNLHQLYCHITPDNKASLHLFKKAGFEINGTCKDWTWWDNQWNDAYFMQLITSKISIP